MNMQNQIPLSAFLLSIFLASAASAADAFNPIAGLAQQTKPTDGLVVVDCSIDSGDELAEPKKKKTSQNFAKLIAKDSPEASVIGMQNVVNEKFALKMQGFLREYTGSGPDLCKNIRFSSPTWSWS